MHGPADCDNAPPPIDRRRARAPLARRAPAGARAGRGFALWLALVGVAACGDGGGPSEGPALDAGADVPFAFDLSSVDLAQPQDTTGPADPDTETTPDVPAAYDVGPIDAGTWDAGPPKPDCPGQPLCACAVNGDCDNAQCIETPEGKQCAESCIDQCSDNANFKCATVDSSGGDVTTICVPKYGHMCDPCSEDKACKSLGLADSLCVDHGAAGAFCAVACAVDAECKPGFSCKSVKSVGGVSGKQCVPDAPAGSAAPYGDCTCSSAAVKAKLSTTCYLESVDAEGNPTSCAGKRLCQVAGLTPCTAPKPEAEVCDGVDNDCDGKVDESSCDDANACTQDACKNGSSCVHIDLSAVGCDADGNVCTADDQCQQGICVPGPLKNCDDKNPCTVDACDPAAGCTQVFDDGAPCDDDDPCTGGETCLSGQCLKGTPKDCSTANTCVVGICDLGTGKCKFVDQPKGTPCEDGNACSVDDGCSGSACLAGGAKSCDDANPCTTDSCDAKAGCTYEANAAPCDDGAPCTVGDACKDKVCAGGPQKGCADTNPCTADSCDPKTGACQHLGLPMEASPCDADDSLCTVGDACKSGVCAAGNPVSCGDGQPCTANTCNPKTGKCEVDASKLEGTPCDADGSVCTEKDTCKGGSCVKGVAKVCDDGNACTDDSCEAKTGCVQAANGGLCDDGNACSVGDLCKGKACVGGAAKSCDDLNVCTLDACDPKAGCTYKVQVGHQEACYEGPPKTEGQGLCKGGLAACSAEGKLGPCAGQVLPKLEVCDGADNDCNGAKDEGCKAGSWGFSVVPVSLAGTAGGKTVQAWGGRAVVGESPAAAGGKTSVSWSLWTWLNAGQGK